MRMVELGKVFLRKLELLEPLAYISKSSSCCPGIQKDKWSWVFFRKLGLL